MTGGSGSASRRGGDERLSRALTALLRHGAGARGVRVGADGFADVGTLLALPQFAGASRADVARVAAADAKRRLTLSPDGSRVRAAQGHSLRAVRDADLLTRVGGGAGEVPPARFPTCVHGTTLAAWGAICADAGLRVMRRNHVHFATALPGAADEPLSGMRRGSKVLVFVDLPRAVAAGVPFFVSDNDVLLSPGINVDGVSGVVPSAFFIRVVDRETGRSLLRGLE